MKNFQYTCTWCEKILLSNSKVKRDYFLQTGRIYCSVECGKMAIKESSAKTMAATNRKYASSRMKKKNPMYDPKIRGKMSSTLRKIGHKPIKQGGNGKEMPVPQKMLMTALGEGWKEEFVFPTKSFYHKKDVPTTHNQDMAH